jgi:hypothetical protein
MRFLCSTNQPKKTADIYHFKSHPKNPRTAQVVASDYRSRAGLHALRLTESEKSKAIKMLLIANVHLQGQLGKQDPYAKHGAGICTYKTGKFMG